MNNSPHAVPLPMMKISANPSANINIGSSVTLYCEATLDSGVDAAVSVSLTWGGPRVINSNESATERDLGMSNLTMSDVKKEDEGEYTCTVRVSGGRYILGTNATESITVSVSGERQCIHYHSPSMKCDVYYIKLC